MQPSTRNIVAGIGLAAIGLAAYAQPNTAGPPNWLRDWVQDTPVDHLDHCPPEADPVPQAFTFNKKTFDWCLIDGPYQWDGKDWYVQRLKRIGDPPSASNPSGGPWNDVIRVCSPQAKRPKDPPTHVNGPCGTAAGAGPGGCQICVFNGVPQT